VTEWFRTTRMYEHVFATDLDTLWGWFGDREAHVAFDHRLLSLTVVSGVWQTAGCVVERKWITDRGTHLVSESELLHIVPGYTFTDRHEAFNTVATTVRSTTVVDGGVLYRIEQTLETTSMTAELAARYPERIEAILAPVKAREAQAHATGMAVIQSYLDSLGRRQD